MLIFNYLYILMFFSGLYSFCVYRSHLLSMLLSLEFMVLSIFGMLFTFTGLWNGDVFFSLIYLTMSVCEGSLGLAILVLMIRSWGNDYILSLNSLW